MAKVYKGVKSRIAGLLYGTLWVAVAAGVTFVLWPPGASPGVKELAPFALPALVALFGLSTSGRRCYRTTTGSSSTTTGRT